MIIWFKKRFALLLLIGVVACKPDSPFTDVGLESDFELNVATSVYEGGISTMNGTHRIPFACPLDLKASKTKGGLKFAYYFNLDVHKLVPTIGDLKPRYIMMKKKNEPYVYGIKAGDTIAFRLIDFPK